MIEIDFVNFAFKTLFFVAVGFYMLYSFLLLLRIRILSETIETPYNKFIKTMAIANMVIALIGGFLALILILPA